MINHLVALGCVTGLAIGQLLFKYSAQQLRQTGQFLSPPVLVYFVAAILLYGVTSIVWVWLLQRIPLGRVYPIMALAFVLVPLGSHWLFQEKFSATYVYGMALLLLGLVLISRA